jgi:hypothetical protein
MYLVIVHLPDKPFSETLKLRRGHFFTGAHFVSFIVFHPHHSLVRMVHD